MLDKKYKVSIIGLGNIGLMYDLKKNQSETVMTHAKAFHINPNFELLSGLDKNQQNNELFSNQYKVPSFNNIEDFLSYGVPDIIVISAPTILHEKLIIELLKKISVELILCEKPFGQNIKEAHKISKFCVKNKTKILINYIRRTDRGVLEVKENIDNLNFKPPFKGYLWYNNGLINNGFHFLDTLQFWFGDINEVNLIPNSIEKLDNDFNADIRLIFKNAEIFFINTKQINYRPHDLDIIGSNGRLYYKNGGQEIEWYNFVSNQLYFGGLVTASKPKTIKTNMQEYQKHIVIELEKALKNEKNNLCGPLEAIKLHKIINKLWKKVNV